MKILRVRNIFETPPAANERGSREKQHTRSKSEEGRVCQSRATRDAPHLLSSNLPSRIRARAIFQNVRLFQNPVALRQLN